MKVSQQVKKVHALFIAVLHAEMAKNDPIITCKENDNSKNLKLRQSGKAQVLLLILVRQSDRETDVAPNVTGEANDSLTYRNANCKSSDTLFSVIDFFPGCMT